MMQRMYPERGVAVLLLALLIAGLLWTTCSQKNPLDPTSSLDGDVTLLVDIETSANAIPVGGGQAQIRVRLTDQHGNARANYVVTFTTTLGQITLQDTTDSQGYATALLISGQISGTATIQARYSSQSSLSIQVQIVSSAQSTMQISSSADQLLANGVDHLQFTVTLFGDSAQSVAGQLISLSATWGQIPTSVITDQNGNGLFTLTAPASSRDTVAIITAAYESYSVSATVNFIGVELSLSANPLILQADGQSTSLVTAHLKMASSHIGLSNATVRFGSSLGSIVSDVNTNAQGMAMTPLTVGNTAGTAEVIAYYGNLISDTVRITIVEQIDSPYILYDLRTSESVLLANGFDQTDVMVTVLDGDSRTVSGVTVQFATTAGSIQNQALSDANGVASVTLTSSASTVDVAAGISAILDAQTMTKQLVFQGINLALNASPQAILADGKSTSQITAILKRTATNIPVTGALITFGSNLGTITGEASTNGEGVAKVLLTSEITTGTAEIIGRYGNEISDTTTVAFQESVPSFLDALRPS